MAIGSFITPTGGSAGGSTLIPNAVYLDTVSGNNSTAVLGDSSKPYLTMTALIAALPAGNDFTWTIYITGSTTDISMPIMPPKNLTFNADIRYIYNFNFDTGSGSVITITTSYFTWTFLNGNINLKSNAAANRNLGYGFQISGYLQIRGHINIIDWSNEGGGGSAVTMVNSDVTINEFIKRTFGSGLYIGNAIYARIKKVTYIGFFDGFLRSTNTFLSRITVDLISCSTATPGVNPLQATAINLDLEIKELQINGLLSFIYTLPKLTLSDLICSATTTGVDVGEVQLVTGRIVSDVPITQLFRLVPKTLQNLEAKINGSTNFWQNNAVTIDNCRLTVTNYIVKNASGPKVVIFRGNNIIKQLSKTLPLIHSNTSTAPSTVDITGTLNIEPDSTLVDQYATVNYLNDANPSYRGIASALQTQTFLT